MPVNISELALIRRWRAYQAKQCAVLYPMQNTTQPKLYEREIAEVWAKITIIKWKKKPATSNMGNSSPSEISRINLILRCWNDKDFYRRGAETQTCLTVGRD